MNKNKDFSDSMRGDSRPGTSPGPALWFARRRSTQRQRMVGLGFALVGAAACGSRVGNTDHVVCGAGTVLQGAECIAATGYEAGVGGEAGCRGAHCESAGNAAGGSLDAGSAGEQESGGASAGSGGVREVTGAAAAGDAGSSSDGGADSGGGVPAISHWLAFADAEGAFAYDLSRFPSNDALLQLATGLPSRPWSADGRKLTYTYNIVGTGDALYVVDMSGKTPGVPIRLLQTHGTQSAWAADSRSIASVYYQTSVDYQTLSVFDSTRADPAVHIVTTSVKVVDGFAWAPAGHKLFYTDATGAHVVDVVAGVPSVSQEVDAFTTIWSPTGRALTGSAGGNVYLTDVSGDTPLTAPLTTPTVASPSISALEFSPDGSKIAFTGSQEREQPDTYVIDVSGASGRPTRLYPTLPDSAHANLEISNSLSAYKRAWSPDGRWLLFTVSDDQAHTTDTYAVDVSGATPAAPRKLKKAYDVFSWSANGERLFGTLGGAANSSQLLMLNMLTPEAEPVTLYDGVRFDKYDVNPSGRILGYSTQSDIFWLDLADPQAPAADISLGGNFESPGIWNWSPDGNFLVVDENYTNPTRWQPRLIRADGATPSDPLVLKPPGRVGDRFAWQPKLSLGF